jgi:glycosyltransferase 2 family protein
LARHDLCMSQTEVKDIRKQLSWKRILIPVILGLSAATYLLVRNLNTFTYMEAKPGEVGAFYNWVDGNQNKIVDRSDNADFEFVSNGNYVKKTTVNLLKDIKWNLAATIALLGALLMVVIRDIGYIYRIRIMTDKQLSWRQSFQVIMLWEFASCMTPSVVGGSSIAMFIINREGINMGKSTAITFVTAMLDEIFYILMVPLVFIIIGSAALFPDSWVSQQFGTNSVKILFFIGYFFIVTLTAIILIGIFWKPKWFKNTLVWLTSFRLLKRLQRRAIRVGDEIIITSVELRGKKPTFWLKSFAATCFSWTARFFTLNFILLIFVQDFDHWLVYGRQLIMWVIMLIAPTPGGSGIAEIALANFFDYLMPLGLLAIVAIIWRLLTYFPYLFIGAIVLPRWFKRTSAGIRE